MLDQEIRTAIFALKGKGHGLGQIARALAISKNTVKKVLASGQTKPPAIERKAQLDNHIDDIRFLYGQCLGNLVRVREELASRHGCHVSYSTLTRFARTHGIGVEEKIPTVAIQTGPGLEMQHDTSPYNITIASKRVKRHCASLVFGFSRKLFMQFYPKFDRFHCKIFLTDAFSYMGGVCQRCVIDNTSVILACGAGQSAQVAPEMEAFEKRFSFKFLAHELSHCNRKGKIERPYSYIENNFLAGRTFKDDPDLNRQALEWLDKIANPRRLREFKASPLALFVMEKPHLVALPLYIPEVYQILKREVDRYGYIPLDTMRYSAPLDALGKSLVIRETKDQVILLDGSKELARHPKITGADGRTQSTLPEHKRRPYHPRPANEIPEEAHLKALGSIAQEYLAGLKAQRSVRYFWSIKKLYRLLSSYKSEDLIAAITSALEYRIFDVRRIEGILLQNIGQQDYLLPLGQQDYEQNSEFLKGASTPASDLKPFVVETDSNETNADLEGQGENHD